MKHTHNGFRTEYEDSDYKQAGYDFHALYHRQQEAIHAAAKHDQARKTESQPETGGMRDGLRSDGKAVQTVPSVPPDEITSSVATRCEHGYANPGNCITCRSKIAK